MLLLEDGKLDVNDRLAKHLPAFRRKETEEITLAHLLLHTSGFIADNPLADYQRRPGGSVDEAVRAEAARRAGRAIHLQRRQLSAAGQDRRRDRAACRWTTSPGSRIFEPLGMKETGYRPQGELKQRAAPTQEREGRWMIGEVHDPRAYLLGGVAGHAGLFSTADDLAIYAKMLLEPRPAHGARRSCKEATVAAHDRAARGARQERSPACAPTAGTWRPASRANRGEVFPKGNSFGHTGFTGTSLWLDPGSQTAVIFLSNRVHPDGKGNVTKLRGAGGDDRGAGVAEMMVRL